MIINCGCSMMGFFDKIKNSVGLDDKVKKNESKNFRYLDKLIHAGSKKIILDCDIKLGGKLEQIKYSLGIKLDVDDLVIDGNGHTIDAKGKTRIFNCSGKNITLKNITIKRGFSDNGGAIYHCIGADLKIINSIFQENTAQNGEGGAIYDGGGDLKIINSTFTSNSADLDGGAIFNLEGKLTINKSVFNENAAYNGGAVHNDSGGELTIIESTLIDNIAEWSGGAIDNFEGHFTVAESTIIGSSLKNNAAKIGGAINNRAYARSKLTIKDSTLSDNTALECGGAIYSVGNGELTMKESSLHDNKAKNGAAIVNENAFRLFGCKLSGNKSSNNIILNHGFLQIYNASFRENQSMHIILNEGSGGNLGIFYGKFVENNVEKSVVCNCGKFCSIENTIFEKNRLNDSINILNKSELSLILPDIRDNGRTILNEKYIVINEPSSEIQSKICGEGTINIVGRLPEDEKFDFEYLDKKIHESKTCEIILDENIYFESYERDYYEGGIELDMDNLIIDGNGKTIDARDKTRIFLVTGKNITLKNIKFKNGYSHKNFDNRFNSNGGAIKTNRTSDLTIDNCEFITNKSEENGGAIYNWGNLTIIDSSLNNNIAKSDGYTDGRGGAIYNRGDLTIIESTLKENIANHGGAIHNNSIEFDITYGTILDSTLKKNLADEYRGLIYYTSGDDLSVTESTLKENIIKLRNAEKFISAKGKIMKSTLTNNIVNGSGGAIENLGELTIEKSTFSKNTAQGIFGCGGAIQNSGELTITESTLTDNTVSGNGGAIYLRKSRKYESDNCTFKDNIPDDVYEKKD